MTHGAPADHARGFGGPADEDADDSAKSAAPRGGLRRLEGKRAEMAKELSDSVTGLIVRDIDMLLSRSCASPPHLIRLDPLLLYLIECRRRTLQKPRPVRCQSKFPPPEAVAPHPARQSCRRPLPQQIRGSDPAPPLPHLGHCGPAGQLFLPGLGDRRHFLLGLAERWRTGVQPWVRGRVGQTRVSFGVRGIAEFRRKGAGYDRR